MYVLLCSTIHSMVGSKINHKRQTQKEKGGGGMMWHWGKGGSLFFGLSLFTLINFSPTLYNHTIYEVTETVTTIKSHIQYHSKVSYQSRLISCMTRIVSHATRFSSCVQCNLYTIQPPSTRCSPLLVFPLEVPYIHPWRALQQTKNNP